MSYTLSKTLESRSLRKVVHMRDPPNQSDIIGGIVVAQFLGRFYSDDSLEELDESSNYKFALAP